MLVAIVPAYNEEKRIHSVIERLRPHVAEVIVVDDGSRDNTRSIAEAAGATVLTHRINRGQGAALETGHDYVRHHLGDYVLHFDGDGQFDVEDIAPALARLQAEEADILFGSRFLGVHSDIPWMKAHVIFPIAKIVHRLLGVPSLSDPHNGFRILTRRALDGIVITQDKMAHATEIPLLAKRCGFRAIEHPVRVEYHEYGQGMTGGFRIVRDLIMGWFVT